MARLAAQYPLPAIYSNSIGQFDKIFGYAGLPTHNDFA
jgi:hypothetical protein